MSSRSLAAARSRRAGDPAPPVSGNRPITSIGSQAAFAQQMPPGIGYNMPPPPNNVRTAKSLQQPGVQTIHSNIQQTQQFSRQMPPPAQYNQFYDKNQQSSQSQQSINNLPFSKLSVSDAIGLITLRLGRVEQWVIETDHENQGNETNNQNVIPDNHKIIDNSVLTTMINRLDSLEKNTISSNNNEVTLEKFNKLSEDVKGLNDILKRFSDDISNHTIEISKNTEQVFRFNRELTETKDILKTFMLRYDQFTEDTKTNFQDFENALADLENRVINETQTNEDNEINSDISEDKSHNIDNIYNQDNVIMSVDLKNIIKQELANI